MSELLKNQTDSWENAVTPKENQPSVDGGDPGVVIPESPTLSGGLDDDLLSAPQSTPSSSPLWSSWLVDGEKKSEEAPKEEEKKSTNQRKRLTESLDEDLDELISASDAPSTKETIKLGSSVGIEEQEKARADRIKEKKVPKDIQKVRGYIFLPLLPAAVFWLFYYFLGYKETGNVPASFERYMPTVEKVYDSTKMLLGQESADDYQDSILIPTTGSETIVADIIQNKKLDFFAKKDIFSRSVTYLYQQTSQKYDEYEKLKQQISQQWYFPNELHEISKSVFFNNSLQKAIMSIESVRFATALNFFSALDSFTSQLSSYASVSKPDLETTLEEFMQRWEKDINNYIVSCYLNGYETSESCSTIGDFERYYRAYQVTGFNQRVFLATMNLIQFKLENTDFPSLDVSMKSIDPLQNTINLGVEINTFKDDEMQLTQSKWILNPHIYLVTSVINNLRTSRYVITDSINVSTLRVNKKKIKIGGETITVNSSNFDFQLPLQIWVQREIYDFADMVQRNIDELDAWTNLDGFGFNTDSLMPNLENTQMGSGYAENSGYVETPEYTEPSTIEELQDESTNEENIPEYVGETGNVTLPDLQENNTSAQSAS